MGEGIYEGGGRDRQSLGGMMRGRGRGRETLGLSVCSILARCLSVSASGVCLSVCLYYSCCGCCSCCGETLLFMNDLGLFL